MTDSKNGVLVIPDVIKPEFAHHLIEKLNQQDQRLIALSVTKGWEEEDKQLYNIVESLRITYQEMLDPPVIKRDLGYVLGCFGTQPTAPIDPCSAFCERVEQSHLVAACLLLLSEGGRVQFPRFRLEVALKAYHALLFPANWMYKPSFETNAVYTISTFFSWQ